MDFRNPLVLAACLIMAGVVVLIPLLSKVDAEKVPISIDEATIQQATAEQEHQLRIEIVDQICVEDDEGFTPFDVCWSGNEYDDQLLGFALIEQDILEVQVFNACRPLDTNREDCEITDIDLEDPIYVEVKFYYHLGMDRYELLHTAMRNTHHGYNLWARNFPNVPAKEMLSYWATTTQGHMSPRTAKSILRDAWKDTPSELQEDVLQPSLERLESIWCEHVTNERYPAEYIDRWRCIQ